MDREQLKMLPRGEVIKIRGANEHNLKNIDLDIPRNKFVVLTGLSVPSAWISEVCSSMLKR